MAWWSDLTVSLAVVYLGFYTFIVFLSVSIACGLYYIAELIEEYTITAKRVVGHIIRATLALHLLLLLDRLPPLCLLAGAAAHLAYLRNMRRFPYIQLSSPEGLTSVGLFVVSNVLWIRHYWDSHYTAEYIGAFLLVTTWTVPFLLFVSLAGDQAVLPGAQGEAAKGERLGWPLAVAAAGRGGVRLLAWAGAYGSTGFAYSSSGALGGGGPPQQAQRSGGRKRRGVMLSLFDMLRRKRDAVLPEMLNKLPDPALHLKEKL
eukprot:scaffold1.g5370.t1